ncbi:hypothetical protein OHR68_12760 [Spirillospora sp. NBC_00431]
MNAETALTVQVSDLDGYALVTVTGSTRGPAPPAASWCCCGRVPGWPRR